MLPLLKMAIFTLVITVAVACLAILLYGDHLGIEELRPQVILSTLRRQVQDQAPLATFFSGRSNSQAGTEAAWNLLHHLGGNSPWITKTEGVVEGGIDTPYGCRVDQVHMLSRHAERYPTIKAGIRMLELYQRIQHAETELNGTLAFVNTWNFFAPDPSTHFESLVSTGPYAGTLEAFTTGTKLRTRYKHLLDEALTQGKISFWASDSKRVVETARYFATGFFGIDWQNVAKLHVIPETAELGGNTLTPGVTCRKYAANVDDFGHDYGARMLSKYRSTYLPAISERLAQGNPGLLFSEGEIYTMQEICGFETIALGHSPWCDVFTEEEWSSFEYARDIIHYYRAGAGNPYGTSMGWLWLNATTNLLRDGPEEGGPLFLSFVHDGDIVPMLAALDLFPQTPELPVTHILQNRTWHTSDVVPMGGRVIFERLARPATQHCWTNEPFYPNHVYCEPARDEHFVRINVNDGIVPLPGCDSGPGRSCPLDEFLERVKRRGEEVGSFVKFCGLEEGVESRITFLHQ